MNRYIAFRIPLYAYSRMEMLPEPTLAKRYTTMSGQSNFITIAYVFQYPPQNWKETQLIATIRAGIKKIMPEVEYKEIDGLNGIDGRIWTISELTRNFSFIKFPKPYFPPHKKKMYQCLCIHAKRLHYEGLLYFEQLEATAMRINDALGRPYSPREVMRKAKAAHEFAKEHCDIWPRKLEKAALKEAKRQGGITRGEQMKEKARKNRQVVKIFLPMCMKSNNKPDVSKLIDKTGLSRRTIYGVLQELREVETAAGSHIDKSYLHKPQGYPKG